MNDCHEKIRSSTLGHVPDAYNNQRHTYDINEEHTHRLPVVVRVSCRVFDSMFAPAERSFVRVECRRDV